MFNYLAWKLKHIAKRIKLTSLNCDHDFGNLNYIKEIMLATLKSNSPLLKNRKKWKKPSVLYNLARKLNIWALDA
jgi:hypothetical protein